MTEPAPCSFVLSHRGVLRVGGEDARSLLQGLLTCNMDAVTRGRSAYGALLTPQGKITCEAFVFEDADGAVLLDTPAQAAADMLKRLKQYRLRSKVTLDDLSGERSVVLDVAAADTDDADRPRDPRGIVGALRFVGAEQTSPAHGYDDWRIAHGLPEQGRDYGAGEVFASDVNLDALNGVDYAKGCFIGQEVVSRMKRRGSVRKRTLIAEFPQAAPAKGTGVMAGASRIGEILSSAGNTALGLVRTDRLAVADAAITAGGMDVQIRFPDQLSNAEQGAGQPT